MWPTHAWMCKTILTVAVLITSNVTIVTAIMDASKRLNVTSGIDDVEINRPFKFHCSLPNPANYNVTTLVRVDLKFYNKDIDGEQLMLTQFVNNRTLGAEGQGRKNANFVHRHSFSYTSQGQTFTLTMSNSTCADDGSQYKCVVCVYYVGDAVGYLVNDSKTVYVKARPGTPTMTQPTSSVMEHQNMAFICVGNVGRPDKGRVRWRVTGPHLTPDNPGVDDSRLTTGNVQGRPSCTIKQTSILNLVTVDRKYQGATVSCFVTNRDFRRDLPETCTHPDRQLCQRSSPIQVYTTTTTTTTTEAPSGLSIRAQLAIFAGAILFAAICIVSFYWTEKPNTLARELEMLRKPPRKSAARRKTFEHQSENSSTYTSTFSTSTAATASTAVTEVTRGTRGTKQTETDSRSQTGSTYSYPMYPDTY